MQNATTDAARVPTPTVIHDDHVWRLLGTGACRDGEVLCHLASTSRVVQQRNGRRPVQIAVAVRAELVEAAMNRPSGFFSWNPAMRGAFSKGANAAAEGRSLSNCPYVDHRKSNGRLTWSRAFEAAWRDGFEFERKRSGAAAGSA